MSDISNVNSPLLESQQQHKLLASSAMFGLDPFRVGLMGNSSRSKLEGDAQAKSTVGRWAGVSEFCRRLGETLADASLAKDVQRSRVEKDLSDMEVGLGLLMPLAFIRRWLENISNQRTGGTLSNIVSGRLRATENLDELRAIKDLLLGLRSLNLGATSA